MEDFQAMVAGRTFLLEVDSVQTEVTYWMDGSNMDQCLIESLRFVGDTVTNMS